MPNSFPFFRHLSYLVDFGKIFILEKPYSTVRKTYDNLIRAGCEIVQVKMEANLPYEFAIKKSLELLWDKVIEEQGNLRFKKILIIDDGGEIWRSIPWNALDRVSIAGVEQTQRGITRIIDGQNLKLPVVSVATSGVKKIVESFFIGKSIAQKLGEYNLLSGKKKIGLIGLGSIGLSIAEYLKDRGQKVYFYDTTNNHESSEQIVSYPSIDSLIDACDVIVSSTGKDALKGIAFERISGRKILASASSADIEFASLLKLAKPTDKPFGQRYIKLHKNLEIEILNGGFPLNFDREKNATPDEDIVLTWCLMYVGVMQAVKLIESDQRKNGIYNLDRISQKKVLERWVEEKNKTKDSSSIAEREIDQIVSSNLLESGLDSETVWSE